MLTVFDLTTLFHVHSVDRLKRQHLKAIQAALGDIKRKIPVRTG